MHQKIGRQAMDAWRRTILGVSAAVLCLAVVGATTEQTLPQPAPVLSAAHVETASALAAATTADVRLVGYSVPQAAATVHASWWDPWGAYGRCVLGIGVPAGVAWYFVTTLGSRAALAALRSQPAPPWAGAAAKRYANAVWNSCVRFVRS